MKFRPKHKYGARPCAITGIKFPSQLEKNCYITFLSLKEQKKILFFLRQIPFDLVGGAKHQIDFMVFTPSDVLFFEAKGRDLPLGKLKRQQVEELYNIDINVITQPSQIYSYFKE